MSKNLPIIVGCLPIIFYFMIVIVIVAALSFWTDSNIEYYAEMIKGEAVNCPHWLSFLLSVFIPIALFLNILAEIIKLFVG